MKTTLQKLTEKTLMLERNSELSICAFEDCLVIGIGSVESEPFSFTPLAKLLSYEDILKLESQEIKIGWSGVTNFLLEKARQDMSGNLPEDFDPDVQHPAFTHKAIDYYTKEVAKAEEALKESEHET